MSAGRMAAAVRKAWRRICQRQTPARMAARPGKIARLVPLEGPEAAGGLVGDQVPEVEPAECGLAGLGWVAAWQALMVAALKARPELSRVWVDRTQLPGWTDEAPGITISLLLRPAARLGEMLAGVSAPRVPRVYIRRSGRQFDYLAWSRKPR